MSFLRGVKKRRIQFQVELTVVSLSDVPLLNAVIFAKVRLMECGTFEAYTSHRPVIGYQVDFMKPVNTDPMTSDLELNEESSAENPQPFQFQCRISFDERTGELEECRCKISLRKEDRTGRAPQKLGFVVLNLSEFAASGTSGITQSFLLDGYSGGQRQDNSRVQCHIKMNHQAQDPLFKVPTTSLNAAEEEHLNPADRKAPSCTPTNTTSTNTKVKGVSVNPASNTATIMENGDIAGAEPVVISRHNTLSSIIHSRFGSDHQHEEPRPTSCSTFSSAPSNAGCGVSSADRSSWHAGPSTYLSNPSTSDQTSSHPQVGMRAADALPLTNSSVGHHHSARRMSEERLAMSLAGGGGTTNASLANRVQKTRRDAEDVIEEVLAETSALMESSSEYEEDIEGGGKSGPGLALFISKDGTSTALGTHNNGDKGVELDGSTRNGSDTSPYMTNKGFERVTLNDTLR